MPRHHSHEARQKMIDLYKQGKTFSQIGRILKIDPSTVRKRITRHMPVVNRRRHKGAGRRFTVPNDKLEAFKSIVLANGTKTARDIMATVATEMGYDMSLSTFSSTCRRAKLRFGHNRAIQGRPIQHDKARRLRFARANASRDWNSVAFSGEKIFYLGHHSTRYWYDPSADHEDELPSSPVPRVHAWWAVSKTYKFKVQFVEGAFSSEEYKKVLVKAFTGHNHLEGLVFMHDNAPWHTAADTTDYIRSKNVELLPDWPPHSRDLNPMTELWATLVTRVNARAPSSVEELKKAISEEVAKVPRAEVVRLVDSVPGRLQKVIEGGVKRA